MTDEQSLSPEALVTAYLARVDWRRSRAPGPPPPSRTISIWEQWIEEEPERSWPIFEELVRRRPDDDEILEQVWIRLRQLLARHGRAFEVRVGELVNGNDLLCRIAPADELTAKAHVPPPLDVPRLVQAYLVNASNAPDAHELGHMVQSEPTDALPLVLEIISRGPLFGFSSWDTFSPLGDLLRIHGPEVIDAVEEAAAESVLVRRCLWQIGCIRGHPPDEYDISAEIFSRLERAAAGTTDYNSEDPPGAAHSLPPELERVVGAWFQYEETFWAWERMRDLTGMDPELAWRVITLLMEESPSEDVLGSIGAGPLEDLLSDYGEGLIDRVETRARSDARFRECLAAVWQSDMSDELWARVQNAVGRSAE
jgi:hypothetical protein